MVESKANSGSHRDFAREVERRTAFIRRICGSRGIVFANSGGKDSALAGLLCKFACNDTISLAMPSGISRSYGEDLAHAKLLEDFGIPVRVIDIAGACADILGGIESVCITTNAAVQNIAPRLRMCAMQTVAQSEGRLVCGTTNKSEFHLGYFTKWGDFACDFNPIIDLTATEVTEFLRYLKAPSEIVEKPPSAGLFEGQTDEADMGLTYAAIDSYLATGHAAPADLAKIEAFHKTTTHKRRLPYFYGVD